MAATAIKYLTPTEEDIREMLSDLPTSINCTTALAEYLAPHFPIRLNEYRMPAPAYKDTFLDVDAFCELLSVAVGAVVKPQVFHNTLTQLATRN